MISNAQKMRFLRFSQISNRFRESLCLVLPKTLRKKRFPIE